MFNKLEARVLSEYKRSRAAPSIFYTLIKHCFSFIKHYLTDHCEASTMKGDLCQKSHSVGCHYVGYYSFYRVYSLITSGIIRFIGYTRSLRRVLLRRVSLRRVSLRRVSSPLYVFLAASKQKRKEKTWRTL